MNEFGTTSEMVMPEQVGTWVFRQDKEEQEAQEDSQGCCCYSCCWRNCRIRSSQRLDNHTRYQEEEDEHLG